MTTVVWITTTFLTKPETNDTLVSFYRKTRPSLTGWGPVAALAPDVKPSRDGVWNFVDWIAGLVLVYGILFGVGKLLLGETALGIGLVTMAALGGAIIYWDLSRRGWSTIVD